MIKLQVIGNLGRDCNVKEINGKNVINFTVAHTDKFKDVQGNLRERTTWVECSYWINNIAISAYLLKGMCVYVEGTPYSDAYINRDKQPIGVLHMRVDKIQLLGGSKKNDQQNNASSAQNFASSAEPLSGPSGEIPDDLPF